MKNKPTVLYLIIITNIIGLRFILMWVIDLALVA